MNDPRRRRRELAELAESTRWAQALACRLVGDAHLAEDVVQDVWLAALQRSAKMTSPRAWLAGAIRNLSAGERRDRARRRIREEVASRSEALPAASETAARLEAQEILIGCLLAIEEPFRETLISRHVDGLAPREIAAREGVPLSTVHGRLDRGLKRLRASLERQHGGDAAQWMAALVPLIPAKGTAPATVFTGVWMMKKVSIVAVILATLGSLGWMLVKWNETGAGLPADLSVAALDPVPLVSGQPGVMREREPALVSLAPTDPAVRESGTPALEALANVSAVSEPIDGEQAVVQSLDVEGQLVLRDPDGRELPDESGQLLLRWLDPWAEGKAVPVAVRGGLFSLDDFADGQIRVESATVSTVRGDRLVVLDTAEFELTPSTPVILRGRLLPDTTLRVVDARSGEDLRDVSVLPKLPEYAGPEARVPGPHYNSGFCVVREPSPVLLPPCAGTQPYWVTARDHAWKFIQIDHETGGEFVLALEPAGSLAVQIVGPMDALGSNVFEIYTRIYDLSTGELMQSARIGESGFQGFPGVPEGAYDVRVEVGREEEDRTLLGAGEVNVIAGEQAKANVRITGIPFPEAVHVQGTLTLPECCRELDLSLSLRPDRGPTLLRSDVKSIDRAAMSERSGSLGWNADELSPGPYRCLVEPFQYETVLEVPRNHVDNLKIVVPELFPVQVRITDSASAESVLDATLRWSRGGAARTEDARKSMAEDGIILLHMPAGPATFSAVGAGHGKRSVASMIGPGTNRIDLELPQVPAQRAR